VDSVITIPNERLLATIARNTPLTEAFAAADDVLRQAIQGISDLILVPGLINLDFADVKTIMNGRGVAVMGNVLGQGIDLGGSEPQRFGHDAHRRARAHGIDVGNDGDVLFTEGLVDVVDDFISAGRAEVDVDVRHLSPIGIEEAFKE
jgi:hypothetical protein